jgi:hypothetical protein
VAEFQQLAFEPSQFGDRDLFADPPPPEIFATVG